MDLQSGEAARTRVERMQHGLADRMAERSLASMGRTPLERTAERRWARVLVLAVVLPVHLITLVFAAGGVLLVVAGPGWLVRILGLVCLMVALATRPKMPRARLGDAPLLTRGDAPQLYRLLDEIAVNVGARTPDEVRVTAALNASVRSDGLRRQVLEIGAPLWFAMEGPARLGLLGHELGHLAHGDLAQGRIVSGAVQTLARWYDVVAGGTDGDVMFWQHLLLMPFRAVVVGYLLLVTEALGPLERRKEYLADLDAVRVAGTDGALATLDTLISMSSVETAMTRAVLRREPDLWGTIREAMGSLSREARLHRRSLPPERRARVGDTHPAAQLRVRLVQSWPRLEPTVRRMSPEWEHVDRELAPALPGLAREVADRVKHW